MKTIITFTIIFLTLILWFKAISDITRTRFKSDKNNRTWFLTVLLIPVLGAILYFSMKKKYIVKKTKFQPGLK